MASIIVGLGNPGEDYASTRHNTGRIILELMGKKWGIEQADFKENSKIKALTAAGTIGKEKITLIEPNNFMNNSGKSVTTAKNLIVIHDDLDLPVGAFKISWNRGSGGHRGVESIIKAVKTEEFIRFRVGISPLTPGGKLKKPHGDAVEKHIMGEFKPAEMTSLKKIAAIAAEAIETIVADKKSGLARAMTKFNK
jgi:PTH1 family peptidyl-tRNA hydrolase